MSTVVDINSEKEKRGKHNVQYAWIEIGPLAEVPILGSRVVKTPRGDVAVFRSRDNELFALDDSCPHRGGPLSQGIVTGTQVICPLHDWCISLQDGCAQAPDEGHTGTYPVKVEDGLVYLSLTDK